MEASIYGFVKEPVKPTSMEKLTDELLGWVGLGDERTTPFFTTGML